MRRAFAISVVRLRYLVIAAWIAAAVAATLYLPGLRSGEPLELGGLVPDDSPAIEAGARSQQLFSVPLTADTTVVERDEAGFSVGEQRAIVERAVAETTEERGGDEILLALPILNTKELFPGSEEDGTTAVTHLFFSEGASLTRRVELANEYADRASGHFAGVTGPGPARLAQFEEIEDALPLVELGTVLAIALVVGLTFRALGAPLLTLTASGLAFLVAAGVIPWTVERLGASIPEEVEPLVVALTLGIVTDYTIFFLSAGRRELAHGVPRLEAAERACLAVAPIVATAGLIVVAGSAALLVGELEFFRAFGPALAITAAVSLAVSLTFVPAALALFGRLVFWPTLKPGEEMDEIVERPTRVRSAIAGRLTSRPVAALIALVIVAGLLAAASGIRHTELALRLGSGLPPGSEVQEAAAAADQGFAAGILAPTIVLVEGEGVGDRAEALAAASGRRSLGRPTSRAPSDRASSRRRRRATCSSRRTATRRGSRSSSTSRRSIPGPSRPRAGSRSGCPRPCSPQGSRRRRPRSPARRRSRRTRSRRSWTARPSWERSCSRSTSSSWRSSYAPWSPRSTSWPPASSPWPRRSA
jgi:RND superfamily putative drug exporter